MEADGPYIPGELVALAAQRVHLLFDAGFEVIVAQLRILLGKFEERLAFLQPQGDRGVVGLAGGPAGREIRGDEFPLILEFTGEGAKG